MSWQLFMCKSDTEVVVLDRPEKKDVLLLAKAKAEVLSDLYYDCEVNEHVSEMFDDDGDVIGYSLTTPSQVNVRYYVSENKNQGVLFDV